MHADGEKLTHGDPLVAGASVSAELVEQRKDKKVVAFKYRRRKGYHRTVGHRRKLTRVKITGISLARRKGSRQRGERVTALNFQSQLSRFSMAHKKGQGKRQERSRQRQQAAGRKEVWQ